jgi:hypothetical protein
LTTASIASAAAVITSADTITFASVVNSRRSSRPPSRTRNRLREQHAGDDEGAGRDDQRVDHVVAEAPRAGLAAHRKFARERRHEDGAHRALGEQIAHEVRNAKRDDEGVHRVAGAECGGEHLIADQPRGCGW